jgi:hypothetical protein
VREIRLAHPHHKVILVVQEKEAETVQAVVVVVGLLLLEEMEQAQVLVETAAQVRHQLYLVLL